MTKSVAIIGTRGYPSYYGGFETAVRHIAPHLADNGWDVTVYGRPGSIRHDDPNRHPNVTSVETRGINSSSLSTLSHGLSAAVHSSRRKPDVALVMNVANGFWLPILRHAGIPTVVNVDGIEWERAKWNKTAKRIFKMGAKLTARYATSTIADAKAIGRRWQDEFTVSPIVIPYGGVEPGELPLVEGLEHRGYILLVARFVPENTINEFFEAVDQLAGIYPIVIVGSSGYHNEYDRRAESLAQRHPNVKWLGHISNDNKLHSLWQHCGVYFHGHSVGGTNPAIVQAMACGAPTVARDTVFNREVLGETANFVDPEPNKIVTSIITAMESARHHDPSPSLQRCREFYSWDLVCNSYENELNRRLEQTTEEPFTVVTNR